LYVQDRRKRGATPRREGDQKAEKHFKLEAMIHEALKNNEFKAHFQAKMEL
tara:strand:+ start:352 stop:504 length:153 start_codon:yes stop_codon:yes gene_type:complete